MLRRRQKHAGNGILGMARFAQSALRTRPRSVVEVARLVGRRRRGVRSRRRPQKACIHLRGSLSASGLVLGVSVIACPVVVVLLVPRVGCLATK